MCAIALWYAVTIGSSASTVSDQSGTSTWSGVYTLAQAKAGGDLYVKHCAGCHGDELAGMEQAPALTGSSFRETWHNSPLRKLYDRIEKMPPDEPKILTPDEYVSVLAFLLQASEFPAGSVALSADRSALANITFSRTRPDAP